MVGYIGYENNENGVGSLDKTLYNAAQDYASKTASANITSDIGSSIETSNIEAGPFKVTYTGEISSIIVKDENEKEVNVTYKQNGNKVEAKDIISGEEFYVINGTDQNLKDMTITVSANPAIKVSIWVFQDPKYSWQRLIAVKNSESTEEVTASVKIDINTSTTLRVVKYAEEDKVRQTGVGFIIYRANTKQYLRRKGIDIVKEGKMTYKTIDFEWIDSRDKATIFETVNTDDNWNGYFQIEQMPIGNYCIGEVYNSNEGYESSTISMCKLERYKDDGTTPFETLEIDEDDIGTNTNITGYENDMNVVTITIGNDANINALRVYDTKGNDKNFKISIEKMNLDSSKKLSGAKFKIEVFDENGKNIGWLKRTSDIEYEYDESYDDSTTWSTTEKTSSSSSVVYADSKGEINIKGLNPKYEYKVYEIKEAENCYDLEKQINKGMEVEIDNKDVTNNIKYTSSNGIYCGTVSYEKYGKRAKMKVTNAVKVDSGRPSSPDNNREELKISGLIWQDEWHNKDDEGNLKYDENFDTLYSDETIVQLIESDTDNVVFEYTITDGKYCIDMTPFIEEGITEDDFKSLLNKYKIRISFPKLADRGSMEQKNWNARRNDKIDNPNEANTNKFTCINDSEYRDGNTPLISETLALSEYYNLYNQGTKTLEHINLRLDMTLYSEYEISQNIQYVQVKINGYTYTYIYGEKGNDEEYSAAPTVQYENGRGVYSRTIYPSDIAYSNENEWGSKSLEVYVLYRIDIKNTETRYDDSKLDKEQVFYVEKGLNVKSLNCNFDNNRYELNTDYDFDFGSINNDEDETSYKNSYTNWKEKMIEDKKCASYTDELKDIQEDIKTLYIQFKIKNDALTELLSGEGQIENVVTSISATAKHIYFWNKRIVTYGATSATAHYEVYEASTSDIIKGAEAYYLKLNLGTERIITGTVFKDNNNRENKGEVIGNGEYDSGEYKIEEVKVELILPTSELATRYPKNKNGEYKEITDKVCSDKSGNYQIKGIVPGKYFVRFTYGDGSQKICDTSGNEIEIEDKNGNDVKMISANYKSTIVSKDSIKKALESGYEKWQTELDNNIYNTAVDNIATRKTINNNVFKDGKEEICANTATMSIGVENTINDYVKITEDNDGAVETIEGINFGIIEIPEISLSFDKVVSNIKITNSTGQILAEGNPVEQNISYVSNLDDRKSLLVEGSQYVKAEINEEELYGSKLELQYSITVQNNSDVDYVDETGGYYKYGKGGEEATITINKVYDFISSTVKEENVSVDKDHQECKIKGDNVSTIIEKQLELSDENKKKLNCDYIIEISGWKKLYTTKGNHEDEETQDTAILTVTRDLSADSGDLDVVNIAKVIELEVTGKPDLIETINVTTDENNGDDQNLIELLKNRYFTNIDYPNPTNDVYTTVTPPTGVDTLTIVVYMVTVIISGIVIIVGVIVIKRKVLDK